MSPKNSLIGVVSNPEQLSKADGVPYVQKVHSGLPSTEHLNSIQEDIGTTESENTAYREDRVCVFYYLDLSFE